MAPFIIGAGLFRMNACHFSLFILLGRSVRYFGEAIVALQYGETTIVLLENNRAWGIVIVLVSVGPFYGIHRWSTNRGRS